MGLKRAKPVSEKVEIKVKKQAGVKVAPKIKSNQLKLKLKAVPKISKAKKEEKKVAKKPKTLKLVSKKKAAPKKSMAKPKKAGKQGKTLKKK